MCDAVLHKLHLPCWCLMIYMLCAVKQTMATGVLASRHYEHFSPSHLRTMRCTRLFLLGYQPTNQLQIRTQRLTVSFLELLVCLFVLADLA